MMRSLSANPWLAACQLWFWLWLRPSAWHQWVASVDVTLSPAFALAELDWQQWRHSSMHRLLLAGYIVAPVTLFSLTILGLALLDRLHLRVLIFMNCGLALGLLFGLAICAGAGMVLIVVLGVAFALAWSGEQLLLVDLLWSNDTGILFGVASALATHLIGNLTDYSTIRSVTRQTGSLLITLLVTVGVAALIVGLTVILFQIRTAGGLPDAGIGLVTAAVPALIIGWSITWRSRYWGSGLVAALLSFWLLWFSYRNPGSDYGDSIGGDLLVWIHTCSITGIYFGFFAFVYIPVARLATPWVATVAGSFSGLATFAAMKLSASYFALWPNLTIATLLVVLGFTMRWWRPLLCYPFELIWNTLLLRMDEERPADQRPYFFGNAVFWDELQFLPLYQLDTQLVLLYERNPLLGEATLLTVSATRQRWAAIAAQVEVDVRRLEACTTINDMASANVYLAVSETYHPAGAYLRAFVLHSGDIAAALGQFSLYNQRLGLSAVEHDLNNLLRELLHNANPYARRFQLLAAHWQQVLNHHIQELAESAELRQEIPNPYVVGVPLTRQQEIFVGRSDISRRIEDVLRVQDHPPLLLYGQRRMGKTSLLYNLRWMLPHRILPLLVDLQGPVAQSSDHSSFLYNLAKGMSRSVNDLGFIDARLKRESFYDDPFTVFDDWLDDLEERMVEQGRTTMLLALDEFEALDTAFASQRLDPDAVLGTLRHIIQHRPRFKLLLAGSHTLDEFQRWSSYLINAQTIHLSYLRDDETRHLIERPMQGFPLAYTPEASQRILELTRGHPYLVQLICSELVILKNGQEPRQRRRATQEDVEAAVPFTLERGRQFFADIALHQVDVNGLKLLHVLARQHLQQGATHALLCQHFADEGQLQQTLTPLLRHELVEEAQGHIRFQVQLIRCWFASSNSDLLR
jgi:hypothetical protein